MKDRMSAREATLPKELNTESGDVKLSGSQPGHVTS